MLSAISGVVSAIVKPQLRMPTLLAFGLASVLMMFLCATPSLALPQGENEAVQLGLEVESIELADSRLTGESTNMAALFVAGFLTNYAAKAFSSGKGLWAVAV
mmetsp:Transcript_112488/g.324985  ORF Transcript_112488/g.324985 Transcript_112488/m.324985 type:complete len:103 (+) Transcript_112488:103-411(+)